MLTQLNDFTTFMSTFNIGNYILKTCTDSNFMNQNLLVHFWGDSVTQLILCILYV